MQFKNRNFKNVLFISPFPPPFGGIASWTKILFEKGLPEPYLASFVDTRLLNPHDNSFLGKVRNGMRREIVIIINLFYNLMFRRPDILHINSSISPIGVYRDVFCVLISRLFGVRTLSHYHGNVGDFNANGRYILSDSFLRLLMRFSLINIFTNMPSLNSAVTRFGQKVGSEYNIVIPNYVSDKVWVHNHEVVKKKSLTCIFTGNLSKAKGVDVIVKVAKAMPDVQFHLIGRVGSDVEGLPNCGTASNITIFGSMEQADVYKYLEAADIFLFPSLTEGFPLSVIEAMSIGLPIVCTGVGSLPEMVDEGVGGYIVGVNDSTALMVSIQKLFDFELRKRMGSYNRIKAMREYKFETVIQQIVGCYNKIN
jgi:glycosyltransferase involved in cell wall biosynthesis